MGQCVSVRFQGSQIAWKLNPASTCANSLTSLSARPNTCSSWGWPATPITGCQTPNWKRCALAWRCIASTSLCSWIRHLMAGPSISSMRTFPRSSRRGITWRGAAPWAGRGGGLYHRPARASRLGRGRGGADDTGDFYDVGLARRARAYARA